jgi:prepilin-type N-terminal cleavage/methylation domain-containing protein
MRAYLRKVGDMAIFKKSAVKEGGFTLIELLIALTVLSIGLLALAQMQMASMMGNSSSRRYSDAVNFAREKMEAVKVPGVYYATGTGTALNDEGIKPFKDYNAANNANLSSTTSYDTVETIVYDDATRAFTIYPPHCQAWHPDDCSRDGVDYVRLINVSNTPAGLDDVVGTMPVMKEINVIVMWVEGGQTKKVEMRTLAGRKDSDFF